MAATRTLETAKRTTWPLVISLDQLVLWGIIGAALFFRVAGLDANFPGVIYIDETFFVRHSMSISWGDLSPHVYVWGTLHFYMLRLFAALADVLHGAALGQPLSLPDYYLLARILSMAAGVGTVLALYGAGRTLAGTRAGLISAALFALSPFAIETAHYATVDSAAGFWISLALLGMALWIKGNPRGALLTGVATGLAIATKYNSAVLLIPVALIALQKELRTVGRLRLWNWLALLIVSLIGALILAVTILVRDRLIALAGSWSNSGFLQPVYVGLFNKMLVAYAIGVSSLAMLVVLSIRWHPAQQLARALVGRELLVPILLAVCVFFLVSPFVLLDFPAFVQGFFFPIAKQSVGALGNYSPGSLPYLVLSQDLPQGDRFYYLRQLYSDWGPITISLALVGLWALMSRFRTAAVLPFLALIITALASTSGGSYQATRYIYSIWGVIALLGGFGGDWLLTRMIPSRAPGLVPVVALLFMAPLAFLAWDRDYSYFLKPDTRQQALEWTRGHISSDTYILREGNVSEYEVGLPGYHIQEARFLFEEHTLSDWEERGVQLIILSYSPPELYVQHPAEFRAFLDQYDRLKREWRLVASFEPNTFVKGWPVYIYAAPGGD